MEITVYNTATNNIRIIEKYENRLVLTEKARIEH